MKWLIFSLVALVPIVLGANPGYWTNFLPSNVPIPYEVCKLR